MPHDFSKVESAKIIIVPQVTGNYDIDISSNYAQEGESYDTHTESETANTYDLTENILTSIDIKSILSSLSAGDYVGIEIKNNDTTNDIHVIGLRLNYT